MYKNCCPQWPTFRRCTLLNRHTCQPWGHRSRCYSNYRLNHNLHQRFPHHMAGYKSHPVQEIWYNGLHGYLIGISNKTTLYRKIFVYEQLFPLRHKTRVNNLKLIFVQYHNFFTFHPGLQEHFPVSVLHPAPFWHLQLELQWTSVDPVWQRFSQLSKMKKNVLDTKKIYDYQMFSFSCLQVA